MAKTDRTPLSDEVIRAAVARLKIWRLYDSRGLFVEIHPSGGKYWRLKYRFGGKEKRLALGVFPGVTASDARRLRDEARQLLAAGADPSEARKEERIAQRTERDRLAAKVRFMLDSDGALLLRLGKRCVDLTPPETAELRAFLDATRGVIPRG
ncbi:hypothetical protein P350_00870 [Burkholderia cepacia JBK9]|nr:hypothetical protein P350_00870 [Burkholderia cepacia JBK9]